MSEHKKTLVVYFSQSGNTKSIADRISGKIKADSARIETVNPYQGSMDDIAAQGKKEVEKGYKPEIRPVAADVADYDRIVIGTPTWWYTMAPAVSAFFDKTDLRGKEVILYMTNAGWPGTVIADMATAAAGANVVASKEILFDSDGGNVMITPEKEIDAWIESWQR